MQNQKEFKTLVLKAPTGSGKTYELIKNGLYLTFTFKKTSIISTKNKKLVDQIYEDCINLYKNETINGEKISKKKITIVKHTKEDHLSKELLLDLFVKGEGIIITVHNYLYAFDDFYNISFLNALSYIFPNLVNIFWDEGNFYIEGNYVDFNLMQPLTKHNDTLVGGSLFYINEDWSDVYDIEEGIKFIYTTHYKSTGNDNISVIQESFNESNKNDKFIIVNGFIENTDKTVKLINLFKDKTYDEINLLDDDIQTKTLTSTKYSLNLNPKLKKLYKEEKTSLLIYNYLSTVLKTIITSKNPRKTEELNTNFNSLIDSDSDNKHDKLNSFFIELNAFVKMSYFEESLLLNDEEKIDFFIDFDRLFEKYKNISIEEKRLFNVVSIDNGPECLLKLLYTSYNCNVTFYYSHALIGTVELLNTSSKKEMYDFTFSNIREVKIYNPSDLFQKKSESDKVKNLLKIVKLKYLKIKNKNKNAQDECEDQLEPKKDEEYVNYKKTDFNNLLKLKIDSLKEKEQKGVFYEIKKIFEDDVINESSKTKKIKFDVILKIEHPNDLIPFGIKIGANKNLDISRRLEGDKRIITSANFDINSLDIFSKINKEYSKENNIIIKEEYIEKPKSDRKVDTLYMFCTDLNYTTSFSKKYFLKIYWNSFAELFYNYFIKDKTFKERKFGMIGLPSNKKVTQFYDTINFKNYASYIFANDQKANPTFETVEDYNYTKTFNPNQKLIQSEGLVITSVFSTASIGLNMPHLFYLNVSLNNYKPNYLHEQISIEINKKLTSPKFQIIQESLIQIIGRLTRIDEYSKNQIKCLEITKKPPYKDMLFFHVFIPNLLKLFKNIYLVDINEYEILSFSLIRSKKAKFFFSLYQQYILNNYMDPLSLDICGKYLAKFKVSLIKLLKNGSKEENFDDLFKEIVKEYYKDILNLVFMIIIGQIYNHVCNESTKDKKIINYSKLKINLSIGKRPLYKKIYNILESFYNEFSKSETSISEFRKIYDLYKTQNKFCLDDFIDNEIKDISLPISNIYK